MRGTVWLALSPTDRGPLVVGTWLQANADVEIRVVSVLALPAAARLVRTSVELLKDELLLRLHKQVDDLGGSLRVASTDVIVGGSVEEALLAEAASSADLLVIGRRAGRDDVGLPRLGRVVRRVLRHLPAPTIVTPPDLDTEQMGDGPVLVAVRPAEDARAALKFGRTLGAALQRSVVLTHVFDPLDLGWAAADNRTIAEVRGALMDADRAALRQFLDAEGAGELEVRTLEGPTVESLLKVAAALDPCFIVCGTRQLSTAQRIFNTSVGSTLAAVSPVPVVVVPAS